MLQREGAEQTELCSQGSVRERRPVIPVGRSFSGASSVFGRRRLHGFGLAWISAPLIRAAGPSEPEQAPFVLPLFM
jgi:hypothetical protein